jgi:hypothetical protein
MPQTDKTSHTLNQVTTQPSSTVKKNRKGQNFYNCSRKKLQPHAKLKPVTPQCSLIKNVQTPSADKFHHSRNINLTKQLQFLNTRVSNFSSK